MAEYKLMPDYCDGCSLPMRGSGTTAKEKPGTVRYNGLTKTGLRVCKRCFNLSQKGELVETKPEKVMQAILRMAANEKIPAKLPDDVLRRNEGLRAYVLDRRRRGIPSVVGWAA